MLLSLPARLDLPDIAELLLRSPEQEDRVVLSFQKQQFVTPAGSAGLSCLIEHLRREKVPVHVSSGRFENAGYWERMGFFRNLGLPTEVTPAERQAAAGRFSEIVRVEDINANDRITDTLVQVLDPSGETAGVYSHIISEALNNICQHSHAAGYCASQVYTDPADGTERVHLAIVDHGRGLREALSRFEPASDREAVAKALEVGVSGRSQAEQSADPPQMRNRGIGLSVIRRLVVATGGRMSLWSGDACYQISLSSESFSTLPPWNGTFIDISMPRNRLDRSFRAVMEEISEELKVSEKEKNRQRWKSRGRM